VVPRNADELRDQWTGAHGISATPTSTATLPGTSVETYGTGQVRVYRVQGMGHGTPVDPGGAAEQCGATAAYFLDTVCSSYYTAQFWGLTGTGRATTSGGYVYARGSGQAMGLYNLYVRHTLRQSPPGYYTVADAGCP
jgi:hypothetical protein